MDQGFERVFADALLGSWARRQSELPEGDEAQAMALIGFIFGAEDALRSLSILSRGLAADVAKRGIGYLLESADPSLIARVTIEAPPGANLSGVVDNSSDDS